MKRGWPSPRRVVRQLLFGADGPGTAGAAMLQMQYGAELAGRMGTPHWGEKGGADVTYGGWIASPQGFRGAAQLGATHTPPDMPQPALPNATAPPSFPPWLADWSQLEGVVPVG